MTPREKPTSPADPPPPVQAPFVPGWESTALVPDPSLAAGDPSGDDLSTVSALCPFCGGTVTPRDERCPRCAARVVPPGAKAIEAMRGNARMVYVFQALGLLCGLPAVPGLLLAYANRGAARDTWLDSHCDWQIDTFWGMFYLGLLGLVVFLVGGFFLGDGMLGRGPGLLVLLGAAAWSIDRIVKGWTRLSDGEPVTEY